MTLDLQPKDLAIRYANPFDGGINYLWGNADILDMDALAKEAVPNGVEYTIISASEAREELNNTEETLRSIPIDLPFNSQVSLGIFKNELGYFGNIWVRQNSLPKKGEYVEGHKHHFDHVSMLISGKVKVEVEGFEPTEFTAPTFIVIKKEHQHKFTALEDNSAWFCVFALRDVDGNVTDIYSGDNSPYGRVATGDMTILQNTSIE
jgi:hypothetical protein